MVTESHADGDGDTEQHAVHADTITAALSQLSGLGWIEATSELTDNLNLKELTVHLDSQLDKHNADTYSSNMAQTEDFPKAVLEQTEDNVILPFSETDITIDKSRFPSGVKRFLCRNNSIYTDTSETNRHFPEDYLFQTRGYDILVKYHTLLFAEERKRNMDIWVERNYQTTAETVLHQTDVDVQPAAETGLDSVSVSLIQHDEPVEYDFSPTHFNARVQLVQSTPIHVFFDNYKDATAFYGLIQELGELPDLSYADENRHVISEGWSTTRVPLSISAIGKPAVATYLKTATTFRSVDTRDVAERMSLQSTQSVWNYLSDIRYDPLVSDATDDNGESHSESTTNQTR